jgi:hypothetical protein
MAFLLWFHVATEREFTIDLEYALEYDGIRDDLTLAQPPPVEATISCRGSGKNLLPLIFSDRIWTINLSAYDAGLVEIDLDARNAPTYDATGIEIVGTADPSRLQLRLDPLSQKTVPIITAIIYEPRNGFLRVGAEELEPDSVILSGPESALAGVREARTRSRTFSSITRPVDTEVELEPMTVYGVTRNVENCRLRADIQPYEERVFPSIPLIDNSFSENAIPRFHPPVVSVVVGGARDLLSTLAANEISITVDSSNVDSLPAYCDLVISVPSGFDLIRSDPDSILMAIPQ